MQLPECEHLAVVDLEATCDDQARLSRREMEIIEIGAVMVQREGLKVISEFESFVQPVRHPQLTDFCKQLTTIRQDDVAAAQRFPEVAKSLKQWLYRYRSVIFCSWGDYDRRQFEQDCAFHKVPNPMPGTHVNLKKLFSTSLGISKKMGMAGALQHVGLEIQGTHHRGIDDARNIARLLPFCISPAGSAPS